MTMAKPMARSLARPLTTTLQGAYLGVELVVNGGFDSDTEWIKGPGWTIVAGVANADGLSNNSQISNSQNGIVEGRVYSTEFTVFNYVSGSVNIRIKGDGNGGQGVQRSANGTYKEVITASANSIGIRMNTGFSIGFEGDVDNVSVREIISV